MKFAVTPFNITSIPKLAELGTDIFIVGNETYANRLVHSFSNIELTDINDEIKRLGKEIYISVNMIVHHDQIEAIKEYLQFVKTLNVDGIIFGDLAIYMIARELQIEDKLIYNPETLNTNYYDTSFWQKKGIKGLTVAKEITLSDIKEICERKDVEVSIIGHGHLNMFHSRRPLIENFFKYTKEEYEKIVESRNLKIVEEIRNEAYPIYQDMHGTHIFREKALQSYLEVLELNCLDVFIIDGIFKDTDYLYETIANYKRILENNDRDFASLLNEQLTDHDSGFLYKKTQYDKF